MASLRLSVVLSALAVQAALTFAAAACEEYAAIADGETKEYRDKLVDIAADPLDRLFAFQKLVCSDNPVIRTYAIREGLKSVSEPLVREQIMFDAMFDKTGITIELSPNSESNERDKAFAKEASNLIAYTAQYRSTKDGCISLYNPRKCNDNSSIIIRGDKLELRYDNLMGEFRLAETNDLVGYIRVSPNGYGRIPAVITLF